MKIIVQSPIYFPETSNINSCAGELVTNLGETWPLVPGVGETWLKRTFLRVCSGKSSESWPGLELQNDGPSGYLKVTKGPQARMDFDCKLSLKLVNVK